MTPSNAEATPVPARYRWLKRILIGCGLIFLCLLALRLWWRWEAHRRLQAEIDRLIASGEPIRPADFQRDDIPDEQNAAWYYLRAAEELSRTVEQPQLLKELTGDPQKIRERLDEVRDLLESSEQTLARVRQARSITAVDWGTPVQGPTLAFTANWYSGQRQIARMLNVTALYYQAVGRDDKAVEILLDALALARAINVDHTLIGQLVAMAA